MKIFNWIYQMPQNLLALVILFLFRSSARERHPYEDAYVFSIEAPWMGGVSLGEYIILDEGHWSPTTLKHEYGHCLQSKRLGWFYLPTVGVVSVFWNLLSRRSRKIASGYFKRWPENEADLLGKVDRGNAI